ncbi:alpha-mannosidase 2-like isoform X2 [Choristoneura fumiferana]|uniref:alpha-mannosidase 2-like isoform X2 n=1 Tax=Choristoneura fumiferana TaxID=7141 RepID=UPI003D15AEA8
MALYKSSANNRYIVRLLLIFSFTDTVSCYEKTLRKIVRNQSKMVQTPFDDMGGTLTWSNVSHPLRIHEAHMFPFHAQVKTMFSSRQRPKSAIIASMETGRGKSYSRTRIAHTEKLLPIELRLTRNTYQNISMASPIKNEPFFSDKNLYNVSPPVAAIVENFRKIPSSNFFPPVDENVMQNPVPRPVTKEKTIIIPDYREHTKRYDTLQVRGLIRPNVTKNTKPEDAEVKYSTESTEIDDGDKADYLIEEPSGSQPRSFVYSRNISANQLKCTVVKTMNADIDAQMKFSEFDIEPPWTTKKHYWSNIFNSRYESLMRNPKWPPLKVILVPRTHVDTIWKKTFEEYNNNSANKILTNIVKKLQFYSNLTFTWHEVSHLSKWWKNTSQKSRVTLRRLVRTGKLEITTGCWVESDEATTHIFGLVHLLMEGHQWLLSNLNYSPKVGWLTNTVTHSPTMPYLLSLLGITKMVFTNVHYSWEKYLAEYQISEFIWLQNWMSKDSSSNLNEVLHRIGKDRYPKNSVISHYLQFNSDGFKACGPNTNLCATEFNFAKLNKNMDINSYNVKDKSELLLEQYSKTGTISPHNVIIAPIGGPHRFESQPEFDFQYNNYLKITDFVNINRDIYKATIDFGTPSDFFKTTLQRHVLYPSIKGDFLNFADIEKGSPAYWVGFFTSRPQLKILLRRLQSTLRSTEIIFSFAASRNLFNGFQMSDIFDLLIKSRETVARLLDRNVIGGTLTAVALRYVHEKIIMTAKDCWYIQEITISLLGTKRRSRKPYLQKYVYRDGEFISVFRTVNPGDHIFVFNSLSHERPEIVELFSRTPHIRILDHNRKDVTIQINPVWKYNSDNFIVVSRTFFKIVFAIVVPPLTLELYKIKETQVVSQNVATLYCVSCVVEDVTNNRTVFPFSIQPIETGDIQLESYKHRLVFDQHTGFLKGVVEKDTNIEKLIVLDYGAFRSSDKNSGMFLFNTNVSKPLDDILMPYRAGKKTKLIIIVSGRITTELTSIYGRLLQHSVKIFNLLNSPLSDAIYIETKEDYEVSPKNRDLELFLTIQTDIANGNPPEIYTDNNGFQYTPRVLNISRRIESNLYPMTTMTYIQDRRSRLTLITDHAQGVTALQEGQIIVMLDRRVLFDDGRGADEGLADNAATYHRHYILLENFIEPYGGADHTSTPGHLQLPSFRATFLSNSLNYLLDIFTVFRNQTEHCHYAYLPLIKTPLPCDVSLLTYRLAMEGGNLNHYSPDVALMVLHRQSYSCNVNYESLINCDLDTDFLMDSVLRNAKSIYRTNLAGTDKGAPMGKVNLANFPPMELLTLRINFN